MSLDQTQNKSANVATSGNMAFLIKISISINKRFTQCLEITSVLFEKKYRVLKKARVLAKLNWVFTSKFKVLKTSLTGD